MLEGSRRLRAYRAKSSTVDMVLVYSVVASLQQLEKAAGPGAGCYATGPNRVDKLREAK